MEGAVEVQFPVPMLGQLLEVPPGAVDECGIVVVELPLVDAVDVAAFAIAVPPPAIAPVTANVTRSGVSRTFTSLARPHQTILAEDMRFVGGA
jgi:hypothetical protein